MKYLKFTHVDSITLASVVREPAANGPILPPVVGLEYVWARETAFPASVPQLFGTCPDDSDINVEGVIAEIDQRDWEVMREDEALASFKRIRSEKVGAITVTPSSGNTFDGDETSQNRMARAIVAMQAAGAASTTWKLADNSTATVTPAELAEALLLAGIAQTNAWIAE